MNLQVLVSTMNQTDHSLIHKMNLNSDAIIINQCNKLAASLEKHNGFLIHWYSFNERGVGLSRNNALMRANADIVLFADDDIKYVEHYRELILKEFEQLPKADLIIFNLDGSHTAHEEYENRRIHRLHFFNCMRYGTARIAVRLDKIRRANISFHLMFGGGARYACGEDSIFLADCLRHGLKIYASNKMIGALSGRPSTWFSGYNEAFFRDKGALFTCISRRFSWIWAIQFCLKHRTICQAISLPKALLLMREGRKDFLASDTINTF